MELSGRYSISKSNHSPTILLPSPKDPGQYPLFSRNAFNKGVRRTSGDILPSGSCHGDLILFRWAYYTNKKRKSPFFIEHSLKRKFVISILFFIDSHQPFASLSLHNVFSFNPFLSSLLIDLSLPLLVDNSTSY